MSWFSRSLSMNSRRPSAAGGSEDEEDNAAEGDSDRLNLASIASATGLSVKEDFSNLTKTFTRQLWGVASFLAPPPADKSTPAGKMALQQEEEVDGEIKDDDIQNSSVANSAIDIEHRSRQGFEGSSVQPESNLVEGISRGASVEESDAQGTVSSNQPRLTGLRSDFAELRGTMATGLSRISSSVIRVVAGDDDSDGDGDEDEDSPRGNVHPRGSATALDGDQQSPSRGFDAFLKPLFGNMLTRENSRRLNRDPAQDEGSYRAVTAENSDDERETRAIELDAFPSAIASGIGGISKFASSLLQIVGEEDDDEEDEGDDQVEAVAVNEASITFVRNIATHPETWLDFPLAEDEIGDDFKLTGAQKEHAHALELAAPRLASLKEELCPSYMSEGRFWKIYFVLMHSRLSSSEAQILSTEQVVKARASMLQELHKREPRTDRFELDSMKTPDGNDNIKVETVKAHSPNSPRGEGKVASTSSALPTFSVATADSVDPSSQEISQPKAVYEVDLPSRRSAETEAVEPKSEPQGRFAMSNMEDETEVNEWLDEDPSTGQHVGNDPGHLLMCNVEEDVSFSDLEEDDSVQKGGDSSESVKSPNKTSGSAELDHGMSTSLLSSDTLNLCRSGDGTPTNSSERAEFNDWLTVNQDDVA